MSREELKELLSETISLSNKRIFIWGTGNTAELYQKGLDRICKADGLEIFGYGDNNVQKQGTLFHDKHVYSAEQIAEFDDAAVLIITPQKRFSDVISKQLNELKIENYIFDNVLFRTHRQDILKVYDLLDDVKSKEVYAHILKSRMFNGEIAENLYTENAYFCLPAFLRGNPEEVFVECGGYVGDTIEKYLWKRGGSFNKIIAFEPDLKNYEALKIRTERLVKEWNLSEGDITLYPYGVGGGQRKSFMWIAMLITTDWGVSLKRKSKVMRKQLNQRL